ncbi:serine/threonine-protein kinase [Altererythrobacter sp. ZODW24]|uniref:serine/threonine-protein kinase n=1 Tax=Altererythrobacter sp. ZODW24 TaxID=2185142 RepID=UPI000DF76DA6|nr:serine/threonine-protein kinase [Altererythrobacter sp. ZODW24]
MSDIGLERRALTLFEAMLDIAEDKREHWLGEQTLGDDALHQRVTEIWQADTDPIIQTGAAIETADPLPPPERIGAYRITGTIGSGGMGTVYAAEREEGDFEHSVAIKLIKPGILSERLVDRFNRERQILARLSHPNITRLLDGGATEDGQPYIVMERVDGIPLLAWINAQVRSVEEKLRLFLQVCEAAGYAHRNLIVHRDLTPSNVLVGTDSQVKLIDFGIARPDGEEVTPGTARPIRAVTMTPGYAAPERASGGATTVLGDIYSAGRMLEEIVPSPRSAELDAMIAKATAQQPEQRYLAMDRLAEDIRLYLNGRPVRAHPGTISYRFRKWVSRNQLLASVAAALVVATFVGAGATGWWWQEAVVARDQADDRFTEVRGIAKFMLFDLYDELEPVSGNTKALSQIADEASTYLERLSAGDDLEPGLRLEIARGYHRLSTVLGNPEGANLGRREEARLSLDRAIFDLEQLHAEDASDPDYTQALAEAFYSNSIFLFIADDDNDGAIVAGNRSVELYRSLMETDPGTTAYRLAWYRSRLQAAKPLVWVEKGEEGVKLLEVLVAEIEEDPATVENSTDALVALASVNSELGYTRSWTYPVESEAFVTSLPPLSRAYDITLKLYRDGPEAQRNDRRLGLIAALFRRSLVYNDINRSRDALADLEEAEALLDIVIRRDPDDAGSRSRLDTIHSQKIYVLLALNRNDDAIALARRSFAARSKKLAGEPNNMGYLRERITARQTLADTLEETGRTKAACDAFRIARAEWDALAERAEISSVDQQNSIEPLQVALKRCNG